MSFAGKAVLALFWLMLVPWGAGTLFFRKEKKMCHGQSFLIGYVFLFSVTELLTLPAIWLKLPLHVLSICYAVIGVGAAGAGLWHWREKCLGQEIDSSLYVGETTETADDLEKYLLQKTDECLSGDEKIKSAEDSDAGAEKRSWFAGMWVNLRNVSAWFWIALILIAAQICVVSLLAHIDADDAFYVATATTAVHTDSVFAVNPYTGNAYRKLPSRYVLSPFPIFLAVISQLCSGLHPAILAHAIFPAVFLIMAYLTLYQFAKLFFQKDADARGIFLILGCVLTWFSGFSVYTSGNFQMIRIWQGKGLLAAALLPLSIWLCMKIVMQKKPEFPWYFLLLTNGACCLVSSMGIMLSPLVMGIFAVMGAVHCRDPKRIIKCVLCCIPSIVLGAVYVLIK